MIKLKNVKLNDVRDRLNELREKDSEIKNLILDKLGRCRHMLKDYLWGAPKDKSDIVRLDIEWIDELIEGYEKETEFLLQEDLLKINKIYNTYKEKQ